MTSSRAAVLMSALTVMGAAAVRSSQEGQNPALIPWPATVALETGGARFTINKDTLVEVAGEDPRLRRAADELTLLLRPALDARLAVRQAAGVDAVTGAIRLEVEPGTDHGPEGYTVTIRPDAIRIAGGSPAGVFYGLQTVRQLLPASVELRGARPHALSVPVGRISDRPRYQWRGAMLDVARHFFDVAAVKRYIDLLAFYKFNRLHLHLSDDQGWRVEIARWPNLTRHGARTAVGGGPGGFYTKRQYQDLVAYANARFITVVPEIDMPSHINAALSSYPELTCDGKAPALYTGIEVGFSAFCVDKPATYRFIDDVVAEIAAMTPSPYFHIGGDEVKTLSASQYQHFIERVQTIVEKHGKQAIGWDEVVHARLSPSTIVQYWRPDASLQPAAGTRLILSPANKVYLDMKYDDKTALGLNWAGTIAIGTPYEWDPATLLPGVATDTILGVEAPLWSETLTSMDDVEFMAFPRLVAVAEVAWTAQDSRRWEQFRLRLAGQAQRWAALGVNAYWAPEVDWLR